MNFKKSEIMIADDPLESYMDDVKKKLIQDHNSFYIFFFPIKYKYLTIKKLRKKSQCKFKQE